MYKLGDTLMTRRRVRLHQLPDHAQAAGQPARLEHGELNLETQIEIEAKEDRPRPK